MRYWGLVAGAILLLIIIIHTIRVIVFFARYKRLEVGMEYEQMLSIMGRPRESDIRRNGDDITRSYFYTISTIALGYRKYEVTRIVRIEDDKIVSLIGYGDWTRNFWFD